MLEEQAKQVGWKPSGRGILGDMMIWQATSKHDEREAAKDGLQTPFAMQPCSLALRNGIYPG